MNYETIFERLNGPSDKAQFTSDEITAAGEAADALFIDLSRQVWETIEGASIASSPTSRDFLAHKGGILLKQFGASSVIAQIVTQQDNEKNLVWTPRNALVLVASGRIRFRLFEPEGQLSNDRFMPGAKLRPVSEVVLMRLEGAVQKEDQISSATLEPGEQQAVIFSYYGAPQASLDWSFDDNRTSQFATLADQKHTDISFTISSFLELLEEAPDTPVPVEAARRLADHECYVIRAGALNLLWQSGVCDQEVVERMRRDPHPEISELAADLCGEGM